MNTIMLKNIRKSFGNREVLKDINLHIQDGEIYGLLGPSGAGKTTIIKIITGQLQTTSGTAFLFDSDVKNISESIYAKIGMVLDNSGIYERLNCYDNLSIFADIYGISKKKIKSVLEKVGLSNAERLSASKLSKGMRQRLLLARAIMTEPSILFLDEPTSGLDPMTMDAIHRLILALKENGTSVLLTTHNMAEAYKLCDRIGLLYDGTIVETGTPEEICRKHNTRQQISILLKNGEQMCIDNASEHSERIAAWFQQDLVETIHSTEPNLESVFMELTGQKLEI